VAVLYDGADDRDVHIERQTAAAVRRAREVIGANGPLFPASSGLHPASTCASRTIDDSLSNRASEGQSRLDVAAEMNA